MQNDASSFVLSLETAESFKKKNKQPPPNLGQIAHPEKTRALLGSLENNKKLDHLVSYWKVPSDLYSV